MIAGRKLVGSAQYREGGALLQHGSILVGDDQLLVASLLRTPAPAPAAAATLSDALGRVPTLAEVTMALFDAVRRREDSTAPDLVVDPGLRDDIAAAAPRYRDPAWTWRR